MIASLAITDGPLHLPFSLAACLVPLPVGLGSRFRDFLGGFSGGVLTLRLGGLSTVGVLTLGRLLHAHTMKVS